MVRLADRLIQEQLDRDTGKKLAEMLEGLSFLKKVTFSSNYGDSFCFDYTGPNAGRKAFEIDAYCAKHGLMVEVVSDRIWLNSEFKTVMSGIRRGDVLTDEPEETRGQYVVIGFARQSEGFSLSVYDGVDPGIYIMWDEREVRGLLDRGYEVVGNKNLPKIAKTMRLPADVDVRGQLRMRW